MNPIFESISERGQGWLEGRLPSEYWPGNIGKVIEAHNDYVRQTGKSIVSCGRVPYSRIGAKIRLTFRFPLQIDGQVRYIGTLGFDFTAPGETIGPNLGNSDRELLDDSPETPDELISAYFSAVPCPVVVLPIGSGGDAVASPGQAAKEVRKGPGTILYANPVFSRLAGIGEGEHAGEIGADLAEHLARRQFPDKSFLLNVPNQQLPGAESINQVIRFRLLDGFYEPVADASIGYDQSILRNTNPLIAECGERIGYHESVVELDPPIGRRGWAAARVVSPSEVGG